MGNTESHQECLEGVFDCVSKTNGRLLAMMRNQDLSEEDRRFYETDSLLGNKRSMMKHTETRHFFVYDRVFFLSRSLDHNDPIEVHKRVPRCTATAPDQEPDV